MRKYGEAIPTEYHGVKFRSRLEANVAMFLDALKIKWQYEVMSYLLPSGHYLPDFYCPEIKQFIEVKGEVDADRLSHALLLCGELAEKMKCDVLMFGRPNTNFMYEWFGDGVQEDFDISEVCCSHCGKSSFCSNLGSYHCRACKAHEGDHDVGRSINRIDFSNLEEIKSELGFEKAIRETRCYSSPPLNKSASSTQA